MSEPIRSGSRPTRVSRPALAVLIALVLVSGCTGGDATAPPAPGTSVTPSPANPTPGGSAPATGPASTAAPPPVPGTPTTGATVWPTGEVPHDPMQRTLTGVVERDGGCTVLVVGERRWPLAGDLASSLTAGSRVSVTGNLTQVPPSCAGEDGPGLQVTNAFPA